MLDITTINNAINAAIKEAVFTAVKVQTRELEDRTRALEINLDALIKELGKLTDADKRIAALETTVRVQEATITLLQQAYTEQANRVHGYGIAIQETQSRLDRAINTIGQLSERISEEEDQNDTRSVVRELLESDTEFGDLLRDRIAEMFTNGALTISVDKV